MTETDHELTTFHPDGGPMPSHAVSPATNTNGDPMTETHPDSDPLSATRGPMAPDLRPDPRPDDEPIPDTLRMIAPEDVARAVLNGVACELGADELRVLVRIGERLKLGRRQYGRLYLPTETRSFRATEARQELEDALVYLACAWLKAELQDGAR